MNKIMTHWTNQKTITMTIHKNLLVLAILIFIGSSVRAQKFTVESMKMELEDMTNQTSIEITTILSNGPMKQKKILKLRMILKCGIIEV